MQVLSAFGGGLWIIPLLVIIGIVIWIISGIRSSKSGSQIQDLEKGTQYSKQNVPFIKTWQFKFAIGLLVIMAGIIYVMYRER